MFLRFAVNQAECFRKGIDCPKSIVTVSIEPSELSKEVRNLIADRMEGIDVLNLSAYCGERKKYQHEPPNHIVALSPDFEGLLEAVHKNEEEVKKEIAHYNKLHSLNLDPRELLDQKD